MIIYNPGNSPVVYSDDGKILGGDERIEVASLDKHGKRAVAHGYIVILEEEQAEDETASTEEEEAPGNPARTARRTAPKTKAKGEGSGASAESETD